MEIAKTSVTYSEGPKTSIIQDNGTKQDSDADDLNKMYKS